MPNQPVNLSPFRPHVCWYGVRAATKERDRRSRYCGVTAQRFCGKGAERYEIRKQGILSVQVYLCYDHVQKMMADGYVVTKIPLDNQLPKEDNRNE